MASKLISKGVLVEFYANLLAVVVESFIKDRLKRYQAFRRRSSKERHRVSEFGSGCAIRRLVG